MPRISRVCALLEPVLKVFRTALTPLLLLFFPLRVLFVNLFSKEVRKRHKEYAESADYGRRFEAWAKEHCPGFDFDGPQYGEQNEKFDQLERDWEEECFVNRCDFDDWEKVNGPYVPKPTEYELSLVPTSARERLKIWWKKFKDHGMVLVGLSLYLLVLGFVVITAVKALKWLWALAVG